jgi:hypothetical protein
VLDEVAAEISEQRSSKSRPLGDDEVADLLRGVDTVVIARGKAVRRQTAAETAPDDLKGPTGGYRAPLLRRGGTLLVGFHPDELRRLLAHEG